MKMHSAIYRKHCKPIKSSCIYDAKHNTNTKLKVGDKVLVQSNEGQKGGKLEIRFKGGPYTIAENLKLFLYYQLQ